MVHFVTVVPEQGYLATSSKKIAKAVHVKIEEAITPMQKGEIIDGRELTAS